MIHATSNATTRQTTQTGDKKSLENYSLPAVVEMARGSALTEAQAIVTAASILAAVGVGILALLPPSSNASAIGRAATFFGYIGVSFHIMAAFSSAQIIAQLVYLPDEARQYCKDAPKQLPGRVYYDDKPVDEKLVLAASRFELLRQFGLWRSKGGFSYVLASVMFTVSYQAGYCCLVLQLVCLAWARESRLVAVLVTPAILLSCVPLLQNVISNTIVGYRAAVAAMAAMSPT